MSSFTGNLLPVEIKEPGNQYVGFVAVKLSSDYHRCRCKYRQLFVTIALFNSMYIKYITFILSLLVRSDYRLFSFEKNCTLAHLGCYVFQFMFFVFNCEKYKDEIFKSSLGG